MIGTRGATALALLLALVAVGLGAVAVARSLDVDDDERGRLVRTQISNFTGPPILFPLDEFYAVSDGGRVRALYVYPPGYFGHTRGCRVVWVAEEMVETAQRVYGPGVFIDPCGGSRFDRDGSFIYGPAGRGLDWFESEPAVDGAVVDTRTLYCGAETGETLPITPSPTVTPDPTATGARPPAPAATPTPAPVIETVAATNTAVPTRAASSTPTAERTTCDRVSASGD